MAAPFDDIATAIVQGQGKVMGPAAAQDTARAVAGIVVGADGSATAAGAANIDALVQKYSAVSGPLGERICYMAAKPVLDRHPDVSIPAFARF